MASIVVGKFVIYGLLIKTWADLILKGYNNPIVLLDIHPSLGFFSLIP